ncbi:MAG: type II toxin-antitoxin system VapB family antitoxin [Tepidiformaceae bacterium]
MPTNLALDDGLILEAQELGCHKTKREAVTAALEEYIRYRKRIGLLALEGQIEYRDDYDYKAERRRDLKRIPR